jgi:hypothetical protein
MVWSQSGEEVFAATNEAVVALRLRDRHERTLLNLISIAKCNSDFSCATSILGRSPDGRFLLVEAEGGMRDFRALYVLSTDGTQRYELPYRYRSEIASGAALALA